jgi:hypothetical protein
MCRRLLIFSVALVASITLKPILTTALQNDVQPQDKKKSQPPAPSPLKGSNPPENPATDVKGGPSANERGTEKSPLVIKILPTQQAQKEATNTQSDNHQNAATDWWMFGMTGIIAVIGIIQAIVFGLQARRLRETIEKMDEIATGQTDDMRVSITQATRVADIYDATLATNKTIERAYITLANTSTGLNSPNVTELMRLVGGDDNSQDATIQVGHVSVTFEVKNHGRTPADLLGGIVSLAIGNNPPQSTSPTKYFRYLPPFFLVSGDTKSWSPTFLLPQDLLEDIQKANGQLWVIGYIDYRDKFGDRHRCNYGRHYIPSLWAGNNEGLLLFDVTTASLNNDHPLTAEQEEEREKYKGRPEVKFERL